MRRHCGVFAFVGLAAMLAVTLPGGAVADEPDRSEQVRDRLAAQGAPAGGAPQPADGSPKIPLDGHGAALLPDPDSGRPAGSPGQGLDLEAARAAGSGRPGAAPASSSGGGAADRGADRRAAVPSAAGSADATSGSATAKGNGEQPPEQREAAFDELAATAAAEGSARTIVGLNVDWNPQDRGQAQRSEIAAERSALAGEVEPHGARVTRSYDTLPLVAFELPGPAVDALRRSSRVSSITPDVAHVTQLRETIPQVEAGSSFGLATCPPSGGELCGGSGTTVAMIDSGVDRVHPFFGGSSASRVVEEACFSSNGSCPNGGTSQTGTGAGVPCEGASGCFHGTHVAGIAAGRNSSLTGVAPGASIMSVNVFSVFTGSDCAGAGQDPCISAFTSDIVSGLNRVANRASALASAGRPVASVNMSLGTGATFPSDCDGQFPAYVTAVTALRSAGIEVVAASGNSGAKSGISAPACVSAVVSVGAVNKSDSVASFSNSSPELDILAPGVDVLSAFPGSCGSASGCAATASGTSMATPHVAGAYAVLRSQAPDAAPSSMTSVIESTGKPVTDSANSRTSPRLLVRSALQSMLGGSTDPDSICPPDDPFEPNETTAPILSSGAQIAGIACNDDFFAVWVESGETVTATLDLIDADGDLDLRLVAPDGSTELDISENFGDPEGNHEEVSAVASTSGYHFAHVYPFESGDENSYTLTMTATGCGDAFAPNDSFGSATALPLGPGVPPYAQICPGEELEVAQDGSVSGGDWFFFAADQDDFVAVDLFFDHAAGDIDVYLLEDAIYNAARDAGFSEIEAINAAILGYGQSVSNDETLTVRAPATGHFTMLVLGFDGAVNDYFFSVFTDTVCINDAGDSGILEEEQIKQVDPVFGEVFTGMICADDVDIYGLQVPNGHLIFAQIAFLRETWGGVGIVLLAPNGDIIVGEDDPETEFVEDPFVFLQTPTSWPAGTEFEWDPNTWYVVVLGETETVENFYNLFIFGIEGQGGEGGTGGPLYDMFVEREPLSGLPHDAIANMSNRGAGAEDDEPPHANRPAKHSVWFEWEAQQTGLVTFRTKSSGLGDIAQGLTTFNTVMAAYRGASALTALNELDSNVNSPDAENGATWSEVTFDAVKGEAYFIAVDSFTEGDTGDLRLEWDQEQALPAAPSSLTATAGNQQVVLAWDVVVDDGRQAVEGYRIEVSPAGPSAATLPLGQLTRVGNRWQYVVDGLSNGTAYTLDVTALAAGGEAGGKASGGPATPSVPDLSRFAGQDRFETAALASRATFEAEVPVVYVATGRNFPDALAGTPLAARDGGPILLVDTDSVPTATSAELTRLNPGRIVVLGGTAAVSSVVETQLGTFTTGGVTRLAGNDRYETAAQIAAQFADAEVVYVATGRNFPDALAGGAAAAAEGGPVLLVGDTVPAATSQQLTRLAPTRIIVLGSTGAVSQAVFDQLNASSSGAVVRLGGADRYETGALIVQGGAFTTPVPSAYVATGKNFPDALAGGAIAGLDGSPVILVPPTGTVPPSVLSAVAAMVPQDLVVLGGGAAVSDEVANQVRTAAG